MESAVTAAMAATAAVLLVRSELAVPVAWVLVAAELEVPLELAAPEERPERPGLLARALAEPASMAIRE